MSVTLKDIAKIANVSIGTVSRVMNGKTDEISEATVKRVQKIIEEEGYVPNYGARALKTNKTNTIGLLIPDIRNLFFSEVVRGAEDKAFELGYTIIIGNTYDDFKREYSYLNRLHQMRVDGIIIAGSFDRNKEKEAQYNFDVPLVAIERAVYYKNINTFITTDNFDSSNKLTEILYENGYRSFLYIGGPENNSISQKRFQGTKKALENKEDVKFDSVFGKFTAESGYNLTSNVDNLNDYDIVVCGNDLIAIGALNAIKHRDLEVPQDISVVGFDDMDLISSFGSKLSTIKQPSYQMGQDAVSNIYKVINKEEVPETHKLEQTIIFRDTTKVKQI